MAEPLQVTWIVKQCAVPFVWYHVVYLGSHYRAGVSTTVVTQWMLGQVACPHLLPPSAITTGVGTWPGVLPGTLTRAGAAVAYGAACRGSMGHRLTVPPA